MKRINRTGNPNTPWFVRSINWKREREGLCLRFIDSRPLPKCWHCNVSPEITKVRESKHYYRYDIQCPICKHYETSNTLHFARLLWKLSNLD